MKRTLIFTIMIACPVMTLGQGIGSEPSTVTPSGKSGLADRPLYQPAVPPPSTTVCGGGGCGYDWGPQTAPGAALQGMSQVINSAGQYNLAT